MTWCRASVDVISSNAGYLIRAIRCPAGWAYCAMCPLEQVVRVDGVDWFRGMAYKTHYERGENVPPSYNVKTKLARHCLGFFHASDHGSDQAALNAAKNACEADAKNLRVLPTLGQYGSETPRKMGGGSGFYGPDTGGVDGDEAVFVGNVNPASREVSA